MEKSYSVLVFEKKIFIGFFGRKMKSKIDLRGLVGGFILSLDLKVDFRIFVVSFELNRLDVKLFLLSLDF